MADHAHLEALGRKRLSKIRYVKEETSKMQTGSKTVLAQSVTLCRHWCGTQLMVIVNRGFLMLIQKNKRSKEKMQKCITM